MARASRRRIKKVGLPAGSLVYTGEQAVGKVEVTLIDYDEQTFEERPLHSVDECALYKAMPTATWINTIIATIFMPLTFLAGVYGMNFKHMPELEWKYGYLAAWIIMAAVGIGMGFYFKRKKWM